MKTFMGIPVDVDVRVPHGHVYLVDGIRILGDITANEGYLERLEKYVAFAKEHRYYISAILFPPDGEIG